MTRRITDRESVGEFRRVASEYCALIERRNKTDAVSLLQEAYLLLPELTLTAAKLPTIDRCDVFKNDAHEKYWKKTSESLRKKLGKHDAYWIVFDPQHPEEDEPIYVSLADDLADIYYELKGGLGTWSKADASTRRDIVFSWRLMYEIHWGMHLARAFRAIHSLLYDHIDGEDGFPIGIRNEK